MISVRFDGSELMKILNNTVQFSTGYLEGMEEGLIEFNRKLGYKVKDILGKYIDVQARLHPEALGHVYEWNAVGDPNGRLFKFSYRSNKGTITFSGSFLPSKIANGPRSHVFVNKAEVMESGITLTIRPKNSKVLVFEDNGETVFTRGPVVVEHPGGPEAAGAFKQVVEDFFDSYLTNSVLEPELKKISNGKEYKNKFANGVRGGARSAGKSAGIQQMNISGGTIE